MGDRVSSRRGLLRVGAALLAAGTAGCEGILGGETPTRTGQSTTTRPTTWTIDEPSPIPTRTRSPTGTPRGSSILTGLPREGDASEDFFGDSAAVGSDVAFVGAPGAGSAHGFGTSGSEWGQVTELTGGTDSERFGRSLHIAGDTLLVGAPDAEDRNASSTAYVFERTDGAWSQTARLTPVDGGPSLLLTPSVAIVDGRAVVGVPGAPGPNETRSGAVYAFEQVDGEWSRAAKLVPADADGGDAFGMSLAVEGETLLVGAPEPLDPNRGGPGSVYAFERTDEGWRRTAKLIPGTGDPGASFGIDVAMADETALIGASGSRRDGGVASGVTYVAERSDGEWQATAGLSPDDPDAGNRFGATVELVGNTALVGAPISTGSVYVFTRSNGPWRQRAELAPDPPPVNGGFGNAIAATDETALIGAPGAGENDAGAAYVADLTSL